MTRASEQRHVNRPWAGAFVAFVLALVALVAPSGTTAVVGATGVEDDGLVVESSDLTGAASVYVPVNPVRILDTRSDPGIKRVYRESSFSIDPVTDTKVAAAAGVDPGDITAVIVNTTMVRAQGIGFGTVWPTGGKRLTTSTNNTEFAGHTIPNLVIAPLGLDNKISVYASIDSDVILDVLGVFVASGATTAGRFVSLGPTRAFDTRNAGDDEFGAGTAQTIDLSGEDIGVPTDATGVVLNVTAIKSLARGFYRVWSAGDPEPEHSSLNVLAANYQAGNQVITGVDNGQIKVFSSDGGGLTIDVTGYFTGASEEPSTEGLFVPFTPGRLLDTRQTSGATAGTAGQKINADDTFALQVGGKLDIPATGAKAVALNITAVKPAARGFIKAYPGGQVEPDTSSLNFTNPGQVVPNHAITSINTANGEITVQPSQQTHVVVDASGYFLDVDAIPPTGGAAVTKLVTPGAFVPAALPATSPTSGPYDFLFDRGQFFGTGQRPTPPIKAAWTICKPIRYALNVDLSEDDLQIQVLIDSIEEMEGATGIDFQFAGVSSAGMNLARTLLLPEQTNAPYMYLPPDDGTATSVDLVIGFSNENDTPDLSGGVIGIGGSYRTGQNLDPADADFGRAQTLRGFAVIDLQNLYVDGPAGPATLSQIKATTTHELGHMMGLGHVDTSADGQGLNPGFSDAVIRDQLMFPALNPLNEPDFDDGDLQGLHELYANRTCAASGALGGSDEAGTGIDWSTVELVKSEHDG